MHNSKPPQTILACDESRQLCLPGDEYLPVRPVSTHDQHENPTCKRDCIVCGGIASRSVARE